MNNLTDNQKANISQELIAKAMQCETPEELVELAKTEGYDLTLEEAEAYLDEMDDIELDSQQLKAVAAGDGCDQNVYNEGDCSDFDPGCVTGDTLVMLADGTEKRADELTEQDRLMTWDFDKGTAVGRKMFFMHKGTFDEPHDVISVKFSDGTAVGVVREHLFFDMTLGKFIAVNEDKPEESRAYIGHDFAKVLPGGNFVTVKLTDISVDEKTYTYYAPIAEEHWSHMVNGMFSGCAYTLGMVNRFDFVKGELRYDPQKKLADLEKYGRLPYAAVAEYVSYEFYKQNRGDELSVAIGKGLLTVEELQGLVAKFFDCFFDPKKIAYVSA